MKITRLNKKGLAFDTINKGMISFIAFILIVVLVVMLVVTVQQTNIVCPEIFDDGVCLSCPTGNFSYNASANYCCNTSVSQITCGAGNDTPYLEYSGAAYNGTKDMQDAAALPPQFAQIIVIVVIIVGILVMLAAIGYNAYQKIKK